MGPPLPYPPYTTPVFRRVVISGIIDGCLVQSTMARFCLTPVFGSKAPAFLGVIDALEANGTLAAYCAMMPDAYRLTSIRIDTEQPYDAGFVLRLGSELSTNVGLRPGKVAPLQVNPYLLFVAERHHQRMGRLFLPAVSQDDLESPFISTFLQDAMMQFGTKWLLPTLHDGLYWSYASIGMSPGYIDGFPAHCQIGCTMGTQRRRVHPVKDR